MPVNYFKLEFELTFVNISLKIKAVIIKKGVNKNEAQIFQFYLGRFFAACRGACTD